MLGPPLQYQSLKTVLLHTDANTRFRISSHMPSIRDVEKRIPLKVKRLQMSKEGTVINDTSYRIEVVRYHPEGSMYPWPTEVDDERSRFDFDEFGVTVYLGEKVLLPGDISLQLEDGTEDPEDTEENERFHKEYERFHKDLLKWDEKAVEILSGLKSKGETVRDYIKTLDRDSKDQLLHRLRTPLEDLQRSIQCKKLKLLPFECRRNNVKCPFKYYIEFTITKRASKQIQRFEYTKKQFEAVKQLNEFFFGGRSEPILVHLLDLAPPDCTLPNDIYRLPRDCRLLANQIKAYDFHMAHSSLLIGNSASLDTLWVYCTSDLDGFRHQLVQSVMKLVIEEAYHAVIMERFIPDLANREIFIVRTEFRPPQYVACMNVWLSGNRPVGASLWIQVGNDETAREVLRLVETRHENAERIERCVTIPRDNSTKANIYYTQTEGPKLSRYTNEWAMKIEIVGF